MVFRRTTRARVAAALAVVFGVLATVAVGVGTALPVAAVESAPRVPADGWDQVSAGVGSHTCGLDSEGVAFCWGSHTNGQLGNGSRSWISWPRPTQVVAPAGVTWASISSGGLTTCAVTTSGAGYCWGSDSLGERGDGGAASVAEAPEPVRVSGSAVWATIDVGSNHTCGVTTAGVGYCWGYDGSGQIGNGPTATATQTAPSAVVTPAGVTWASISPGGSHTCGLTTTGVGYCWGADYFGAVGDGPPTTSVHHTPTQVAAPAGGSWRSISPGGGHTCGLTTDGGAYCWGRDATGQLGDDETLATVAAPVAVHGGVGWSTIDAGLDHTCATSVSGSLLCWGAGGDGRLGDGSTADRWSPGVVSPPSGRTWSAVSAGGRHTCARDDEGGTWCWGDGDRGRLGDGTEADQTTPVAVAALGQTIAIGALPALHVDSPTRTLAPTASSGLPVALTASGACTVAGHQLTVIAEGTCTVVASQPGDAVFAPALEVVRSTTVAGPNTVPLAQAGADQEVGSGVPVVLDGSASSDADGDPLTFAWEQTSGPRLPIGGARGSRATVLAPEGPATLGFRLTVDDGGTVRATDEVTVAVGAPSGWRSVSAGQQHSCAVTAAGAAHCWGSDLDGELGDGGVLTSYQTTPSPVVTPVGVTWASVSTGSGGTCGLSTAGTGYCWGRRPGLGASVDAPVAVPAPPAATWASLDVGSNHACGVSAAGVGLCWGTNSNGELGMGAAGNQTGLQTVIAPPGVTWASIAAGSSTTCGVSTAGVGYCWGSDAQGKLGNGPLVGSSATPSEVVTPAGARWASIQPGSDQTCGVTTTGAGLCWGRDHWGQLGDGEPGISQDVPSPIAGGLEWAQISPDEENTCGVTTAGAGYCWGGNRSGQGTIPGGSHIYAPRAMRPTPGLQWTTVDLGAWHGCGVVAGASVWCWGYRQLGQVGDGSASETRVAPVRTGLRQTIVFAVPADGRVGDAQALTAEASSELPVTFAASGGCTVSGSILTLTAAGTCTVTARQSGNALWAEAAAVGRSVAVAPNQAPTVEDRVLATPVDTPVALGFAGSDPDGDALTFAVVAEPAHGSVADGTYVPAAGYRGVDTFTYRATDTGGLSSAARTVTVHVGVAGLAGVVTDEVTGAPIAGAEVRVLDAGDPTRTPVRVATLTTDGTGAYATTLPHGTYVLQVVPPSAAHLGEWFGDASTVATATRVVLDASAPTVTRSVALSPVARIGGTVRSTRSPYAPIAGLQVRLTRVGTTGSQATTTSATGEYAFGSLPAGSYQLWFRDLSGTWVSEWYDEAATQAASTPIVLTGQDRVIDEQLTPKVAAPTNSGTVGGTITDARTGAPLAGIQVRLYRDPYTGSAATTTDLAGRYSFGRLVPGSYKVWFRDLSGTWVSHYGGGAATLAASAPIVVFDDDHVANGALVPKGAPPAPGVVSGTVTEEDGTTPIAGLQVRIYLGADTGSRATTTGADGRYSFAGLAPGTYTVWFRDLGRTWASEWHHDAGARAQATTLAVADGVVLDIDAGLARR